MSTWHQDNAMRREREAGRMPANPYAHPSKWRVLDNPPGKMACVETFESKELAQENANGGPYRTLLAPVTP